MKSVLMACTTLIISCSANATDYSVDERVLQLRLKMMSSGYSPASTCLSIEQCNSNIKEVSDILELYNDIPKDNIYYKNVVGLKKSLEDSLIEETNKEKQLKEMREKANRLQAANAKHAAVQSAKPGARIGMGTNEVVNDTSWGKPHSINRTTGSFGTTEQWVYGSGNYLYFNNGKLTTIQN